MLWWIPRWALVWSQRPPGRGSVGAIVSRLLSLLVRIVRRFTLLVRIVRRFTLLVRTVRRFTLLIWAVLIWAPWGLWLLHITVATGPGMGLTCCSITLCGGAPRAVRIVISIAETLVVLSRTCRPGALLAVTTAVVVRWFADVRELLGVVITVFGHRQPFSGARHLRSYSRREVCRYVVADALRKDAGPHSVFCS